jgi:hypothetical protein
VTDRSPAGRRAAVLVTLAVALLAGGGGFTGATLSDTERADADWTAGTWTETPTSTSTPSPTTATDATTAGTTEATAAEPTTTGATTVDPTTASTTDTTTTEASGSTPAARRDLPVGVDSP